MLLALAGLNASIRLHNKTLRAVRSAAACPGSASLPGHCITTLCKCGSFCDVLSRSR